MPVLHGLAQGPGGAYSSLLLKNLCFCRYWRWGGKSLLDYCNGFEPYKLYSSFLPKDQIKIKIQIK